MIKDKDIRFKYILENKDLFNKGIFINEYKINKDSIVDFALFYKNELYGYEIKSEADNLKRLPNQLRNYLKYFDYIYIIISEKHKEECLKFLTKLKLNKVGIIFVDSKLEFDTYRIPLGINKMMKLNNVINNLNLTGNKELFHGKINLDQAIKMLEEKITEKYHKSCPKSKSNLVYKTSYREVKRVKENHKGSNIYKYIETVRDFIYKVKSHKCIECGTLFNIIDRKKEAEKLISKRELNL
jgi:hypothetical protein